VPAPPCGPNSRVPLLSPAPGCAHSAKRPHSGAQNASAMFLSRGGVLASQRLRFARSLLYGTRRSQLIGWENLEDCMPTGKIKMFDEGRGFGFIKPDNGGVDVFFHVSALRDGDEINQGKAVEFEIGVDPKSGKTKAVSVDLT
jgi:CspA family cold shock protein